MTRHRRDRAFAMTAEKAVYPDPIAYRRRLQRKNRKRLFWAAGFSLLFHLSMITFFEIGVRYPRDDIRFYQVQIVSVPEVPRAATPAAASSDALSLSGRNDYGQLPLIALPVVEFAEMERLRVRYDTAAPLAELAERPTQLVYTDSWARFSSELQRMSRSLRDLALSEEGAVPREKQPKEAQRLYFRPAEGFEAYIEWTGPPADRALLFSPPMKALWNVSTALKSRQLEIVFQVDPGGRVVNVWSPEVEDAAVVDDIQMTLLQYRFSPLPELGMSGSGEGENRSLKDQSGVLFIKASEQAP
jgi:hypothetical protein